MLKENECWIMENFHLQAASVGPVLSGKDVVIAAETGSGKTHSYLVPLIEKLCTALGDSENSSSDKEPTPSRAPSLVLCPNVVLCEQVVRMANALSADNGEPLIQAVAVCGGQVLML